MSRRRSACISIASRAASAFTTSRATTRAYIRRALGPIPMAGFFTGFEIGSLADQTSLLQYSGVLALISGKKS